MYVGIPLLCALMLWHFYQEEWFLGAMIGVLTVICPFLPILGRYAVQEQLRKSFQQSPFRDELLRIELRDDGFHAKGDISTVDLHWSAFTKVVHFEDGFLLFQGPQVANWIPVRYLEDAAALADLEALLDANIAEHKVVEPVTWMKPNGGWD